MFHHPATVNTATDENILAHHTTGPRWPGEEILLHPTPRCQRFSGTPRRIKGPSHPEPALSLGAFAGRSAGLATVFHPSSESGNTQIESTCRRIAALPYLFERWREDRLILQRGQYPFGARQAVADTGDVDAAAAAPLTHATQRPRGIGQHAAVRSLDCEAFQQAAPNVHGTPVLSDEPPLLQFHRQIQDRPQPFEAQSRPDAGWTGRVTGEEFAGAP